ncbi:fatty acyl-AMP ligase [Oscillatoria sp. CS-180]|uniref:fatty acyl-AMP ligase n=1 Tax=Oscillatoria sp. CS-180 TaxID=3021720 RepID=UPI00232BDAA4|nr:fatty acyl-AMP ligase [Oscillatoria sp. CS-180]MDB9526146.1 fatty acyl-AMP ligase [Oscillatoria sp. CS-180]
MNNSTIPKRDNFSSTSTFVDLLRQRAMLQPDRLAFTFTASDETIGTLTYSELDRWARAIAAHLQKTVVPDTRALLIFQPGLAFIAAYFGCLYARVVAVPAYPPRRNQTLERLQSIVQNAEVQSLLTTAGLAERMQGQVASSELFEQLNWVSVDGNLQAIADDWQPLEIRSETLAFLQYTSGSTGNPKGVMISHGNLLHNSQLINACFGDTPDSTGVSWLPPYHDMGLIGGILQPIYVGAPTVLMSPLDFLQKPIRWLQAISKHRATTSGGPNFAYDLCVRRVTPDQLASLDLSSWRVAFNGAEPVRSETLKAFSEKFAPCGFQSAAHYPCYGMAETTLMVTGGHRDKPPTTGVFDTAALEQNRVAETLYQSGRTLVSCGLGQLDQTIRIVNPETSASCASDEIGEIWVAGPSVAQGYWHQETESRATFQAYLSDSNEGPFLRTGDLGFLRDDQLYVVGRLKDLIIIRGQNYYPQDIELTIERSHPDLKAGAGAVFTIPVNGEERIVVVQEVERSALRSLDVKDVVGRIREAISAEYTLRSYMVVLVKPGSIPKTSSGKIRRRACRNSLFDGSLAVINDWSEIPSETTKFKALEADISNMLRNFSVKHH